jgi:hypothetical protein
MAIQHPPTDHATRMTEEELKQHFPGTPLAYEFVRPSLEFMQKRLETMETRIRAILTLTATLTLAVPAFVTSTRGQAAFDAPVFWVALGLAAISLVLGMTAHMHSEIQWPSPDQLFRTTLRYGGLQFQKYMLERAGEAFVANKSEVERLGKIADIIGLLLVGEVLVLAAWVYLAR